ncbi:hypothetical protein CAY59_20235 [Vibrio campbellii]|nr:hypothetical protein CAY59_20235 [Vibrio campbellii]
MVSTVAKKCMSLAQVLFRAVLPPHILNEIKTLNKTMVLPFLYIVENISAFNFICGKLFYLAG